MVGNSLEMDIEPAKEIGMATYWVNGSEEMPDPKNRHASGSILNFHIWLEAQRLGIGGDWCLGATAEDAFLSGRALSQQVLGRS